MALFGKYKRLSLSLAGGLLCLGLVTACQPDKPVDPLEGYRMAVVDIQPLVELHPSYSKLEQLRTEVDNLREEKAKIQEASREAIIKKGGSTMQVAVENAKKKLQAEQAAVEGELASLAATLQAQISGEMQALQAAYQAELKREMDRLAPQKPPEPVAPPKLDAGTEGQLRDYMTNLALVRERNLAAKRLELEKRVGDEISSKKAEVDGQIAAYESDLSAQYQSERLNLQLTAQNSTDEAAKTQAETRLGEIAQEVEGAKSAKRAELEGSYAAVRAEKTSQLSGQLEAYQRELDSEVAVKIEQKRREIGGRPAAPPVQQQSTSSGPPPEFQAKVREVEARMKAQLESKKAALQGQMEAKMATSRERLEAKQDEVEENLKKIEIQIQKEIEAGLANLPDDVKARMEEVNGKIKTLEEEGENLYKSIRSDVDEQVAGIAKDKNESMVVGIFRYKDPSFQDLTDLSQVRIQQMETK